MGGGNFSIILTVCIIVLVFLFVARLIFVVLRSAAKAREISEETGAPMEEQREQMAEDILGRLGGMASADNRARVLAGGGFRGILWLPPALFFLIALFVLHSWVSAIWHSMQSVNWPHAEGVILSSAVEQHHTSGRRGLRTYWVPRISYRYKVDNVFHNATKVSFISLTSSSADAQAMVDRYPAGKSVAVFYSPTNPDDAVLETGIHGMPWLFLVGSIPFLTFGAIILILRNRLARGSKYPAVTS